MLDPSIIKAMVASGASVDTLAATWIADAALDHEKLLERRAQIRTRVRRFRERQKEKDKQNQHEGNSYNPLQPVTGASPHTSSPRPVGQPKPSTSTTECKITKRYS